MTVPWPPADIDGEPVHPPPGPLPLPEHPVFGSTCPACECFVGKDPAGFAGHVWECCAGLRKERDEARTALAAAGLGPAPARPVLTRAQKAEARELLRTGGCAYCSGLHAAQGVACPRVKSFRRDGTTVSGVDYWPHGEWPSDRILWPEDVEEDAGEAP